MRCWFEVNQLAAKALGHIPGTHGERDALNVLEDVHDCMKGQCTESCLVSKAVALAAFGDEFNGR